MAEPTRRSERSMSSVQPENGLPERRMITADSFRRLKLKLAGTSHRAGEPPIRPSEPLAVAAAFQPPAAASESIETLSESVEPVASLVLPAPVSETTSDGEPILDRSLLDIISPSVETAEPAAAAPAAPKPIETAQKDIAELAPPLRSFKPSDPGFVERRVLEEPQPEDSEAGVRAHALLDIMAMPTEGSLPQERALANDTLLRLIPRMPLKSLRHLSERVCLMEAPSQMLVRRLINDQRIEVSGPLLENAMTVDDSDLIALAHGRSPAKLKLMARRRIISPALSEALIQANDVETLVNLVRNPGASFSIESMWHLTRFAAAHPVLQAPLVTRQDTPSPIAFQLFWQLPSELRRYVLSRFLTDSETITRILTMNRENDGGPDRKSADPSLLTRLAGAGSREAGAIFAQLTHVGAETGARIADDPGGEALTVALKAAGLTRAQFADIVAKRTDAEALKAMFETLSFNKARVLLTYWDWAAKRTGPYARIAAS